MTRHPRTRSAFTLVELLVVISIIGILLALTATAVFGVRRNEQNKFSEATLTKLDARIQDKIKKITDQINDDWKNNRAEAEPSTAFRTALQANPDVGKAVMTYARVRQQYPMTFAEAKSNVVILGYTYKPQAAFAALPAAALADPIEEAAVCFYAAVAAEGLDGLNFQQGNGALSGLPVFLDGFGTPIALVRLGYDGNGNELNPPNAVFDPFYPVKGKNLADNYPGGAAAFDSQVWQHVRPNAVTTTPTTAVGWVPPPSAVGNWNSYPCNSASRVPQSHKTFLVSAGPNKQYADTSPPANLYGGDNLLSFRLRKEGGRGD